MEEIKEIKEEIMNLIKDKELSYIISEQSYKQILAKYTAMNKKYIKLYSSDHKTFNTNINNLKRELLKKKGNNRRIQK